MRAKADLIANTDLRYDQPELAGDPVPHRPHPLEQVSSPRGIGQADQSIADLELERIDLEQLVHFIGDHVGGLGGGRCDPLVFARTISPRSSPVGERRVPGDDSPAVSFRRALARRLSTIAPAARAAEMRQQREFGQRREGEERQEARGGGEHREGCREADA